jgi:hypothetical protein
MSTFDSDDLGTMGYFLPEDSQFRLKKLREYVQFLSHLAQPRIADEEREGFPEIRPGEVAICLELLEEQIAQVLGELSWPAERRDGAAVPVPDTDAADLHAADSNVAEPDVAEPAMDEVAKRYVAGVTLDQIDELARLGDILRAHGDVVVATDQADFADVTLSIMGDAILRDAERLRDIIHDIDSVQRLDGRRRSHADVREEAATYLAVSACAPLRGISRPSARLTVVGPLGGGERAAALAYAQPAI